MPPRIPTPSDFTSLSLTLSLHPPSPPESTTTFLLLLHGLGDNEAPFLSFAKNLNLPNVYAISIRGVNPLPPALLGLPLDSGPTHHFHWGDDIRLSGEGLDPDPGFHKAERLVLGGLVRDVLVQKLGWEVEDVLVFGFGQGGSLALGLAARLAGGGRVEEVKEGEGNGDKGKRFKGVVSVGGGMVASMSGGLGGAKKAKTPVLVCHGRDSEVLDEEGVEVVRDMFEDVREVRWKKADDGMPRIREEVVPLMEFFAERLRSGW
ncbi:hypothetical protein OQA88_6414 [Cercophora sp. LCS_1]